MTDPLGLIGSGGGMQGIGGVKPATGAKPQNGPSFKDVLLENIAEVNKLQQDAETAIEELVSGQRDDMANVLNAKRKADLAFKTLLQVRNKLIDAYEEVKQIRV